MNNVSRKKGEGLSGIRLRKEGCRDSDMLRERDEAESYQLQLIRFRLSQVVTDSLTRSLGCHL